MKKLTTEFESEFIPARIPSKHLMIVLHGKGDSLRPFRSFNEEVGIESMNYLLLNAPRRYTNGYSWYGDPPFQALAIPRIRARLQKVIDEAEAAGWKAKDIFIFGFSQGCLVGADLVLHDRRTFAGFIGVSGYFHFYPGWRENLSYKPHRTPWKLFHGRRDRILPIEDTRYGARKIRSLGVQIEWTESKKGHTMDQDEADLIREWLAEKLGPASKPRRARYHADGFAQNRRSDSTDRLR